MKPIVKPLMFLFFMLCMVFAEMYCLALGIVNSFHIMVLTEQEYMWPAIGYIGAACLIQMMQPWFEKKYNKIAKEYNEKHADVH